MATAGLSDLITGASRQEYRIPYSLRFSRSRRTQLYNAMGFRSGGSSSKWSMSFWMKRGPSFGGAQQIYDMGNWNAAGGYGGIRLRFISNIVRIEVYKWTGTVSEYAVMPEYAFHDSAAWYHIFVVVDSNQATSSDRVKFYINGELQTQMYSAVYPSIGSSVVLSYESGLGGPVAIRSVGGLVSLTTQNYDGYLADFHYIEGLALDVSDFVTTNPITQQLIPVRYTGEYGAHGFKLEFDNTNTINNFFPDSSFKNCGWFAGVGFRTLQSQTIPAFYTSNTNVSVEYLSDDNNVTSQPHYVQREITLPSTGNAVSFSLFARPRTTSTLELSLANAAVFNNLSVGRFYLANGHANVVTAGSNTNVFISPVRNGYYRCTITSAANSLSNTLTLRVGLVNNADSNVFPGTNGNVSFYYDGGQVSLTNTVPTLIYNPIDISNSTPYIANTIGIGADSSVDDGSGVNAFYANNVLDVTSSTPDVLMHDTPTAYYDGDQVRSRGNYATLSSLETPINPIHGLLTLTDATSTWRTAGVTIPAIPGKWYFEVSPNVAGANAVQFGITKLGIDAANTAAIATLRTCYVDDGNIFREGTGISNTVTGNTFTSGDTVAVAFDTTAGTLAFYKNNTLVNSTTNTIYATGDWKFYVGVFNATVNCNFGQQAFTYAPPAGYKALNTFNMPEPPILRPDEYFDVATYTGDGASTRTVTPFKFQPNIIWIKSRGGVRSWLVADTARGPTIDNAFEQQAADFLYNSSGFVNQIIPGGVILGSNGTVTRVNQSAENYVLYGWREDSLSGTDAIVYSGDGTLSRDISHNLGAVPAFGYLKCSNSATHWRVKFSSQTSNNNYLFDVQGQAAYAQRISNFSNTSNFNIVSDSGGIAAVNQTGLLYFAHMWSAVRDFCYVGSYVGNGGEVGPFVWTGFRPKMVLVKRLGANANYNTFDTTRDTINYMDRNLAHDSNNLEGSFSTGDILFHSNGFQPRTETGGVVNINVNNTATYTFVAWAEYPFKYTRAR